MEKSVLYWKFMVYIFGPQLHFFLLLSLWDIEAHDTIIHINKTIAVLINYSRRNCCMCPEVAPVTILSSGMLHLEQDRVQEKFKKLWYYSPAPIIYYNIFSGLHWFIIVREKYWSEGEASGCKSLSVSDLWAGILGGVTSFGDCHISVT